jgi:hypothetical protein
MPLNARGYKRWVYNIKNETDGSFEAFAPEAAVPSISSKALTQIDQLIITCIEPV